MEMHLKMKVVKMLVLILNMVLLMMDPMKMIILLVKQTVMNSDINLIHN